ncbi:Protein sip5 [Talaromyces islandicus]|uniref:Protein SIP5 n=1 Tax=Talaromyces islandicus TaxID=28573 RepID=A0A0U1M7B0_TALIS|nr:Protein sip5 [Talaromyces islandicus]
MGNSQTKEARSPLPPSIRHRSLSDQSHSSPYHGGDGSRSLRSSRPDLSFLGIGGSAERDTAAHEHRRETKQDREARRLERDRAARLKERERSMLEEHVDGGYLVTQGVYVGVEDFNKAVVRQLMIERRLAPFWRGLNDFSESWTEHQLMAAARGMPIPPPDQIPPELEYTPPPQGADSGTQSPDKSPSFLTVPNAIQSPSTNPDNTPLLTPTHSLPSPSPIASGTSSSPLFRGRAKTLAALTSSKNNSSTEMTPREYMLTHDPFVNGQPIEAYLYKNASECPICFLYYPPYLNRTRCCDQPICSECFVQIKRPDPHPPEHAEQDQNASAEDASNSERTEEESQLVSEPSACPFCVQPEFGATYAPPPFRRGLAYASPNGLHSAVPVSPGSSDSSLNSAAAANGAAPIPGRRRATSLSANDPGVITTDKIRPDWAQKLASARAHAARRSAAATALHTAAYLMNPNGSESRSIGRRGLRRTGASSSGSQTPANRPTGGSQALHALAFLSERRNAGNASEQHTNEGGAHGPRGNTRRSRIDDLEEMMMMEAIRMSLASEEERRRKEEKEIRKEAKRREKEAKKAEKAMRKNGIYSSSQTNSAIFTGSAVSRIDSSSSSVLNEEHSGGNKGKGVDRTSPTAAVAGTDSISENATQPANRDADPSTSAEPSRPSHLRHMSNASSTSSSCLESGIGEQSTSEPQPSDSNSATEPMFNFRSLASVIGDEEKAESAEHVEHTVQQSSATNSSMAEVAEAEARKPTKENDADKVTSIESNSTPNQAAEMVPKEINAHLVEVSGEAAV